MPTRLCPFTVFVFYSYRLLQSEQVKVKLLKYVDDMALIGLLNFKSKYIPSNYFDAVEGPWIVVLVGAKQLI